MQYRADVYLMDQIPRIGCGWRRCMFRVGPKWVRIEECATGRTGRLPRYPLISSNSGIRRVDIISILKPRKVDANGN